ncbi:DNA repair protein XRCC2 homolog isoform X2 [Asparagus officinalis]|uniref:DNA repair protein XRCC2 homolog isoform X2 n=1 Tax=Asparagus officinalis TaxID=4686 RepID=UPI00098E49A8|nr:DNA repair protein XRCC2 homolog isoform X2 [Asparagus officinalis]
MENPRDWILGDETARDFLSRVLSERPSLLLPPLHRVPLRAGNVVEIVGPSPSAKSEILLQAAINCILPKEWRGVHFGGLEKLVIYFDLDCRFDVLRLSKALKLRIASARNSYWGPCEVSNKDYSMEVEIHSPSDDELFTACMRRFLYIRCYSSVEFLSALKMMHNQLQKQTEALGISVHFLMIDSIGAFQSIDRACQPLPHHCNSKRKTLSLQIWAESVVQKIRNLLQVQPVLVLATKATIFGAGTSIHGALRMKMLRIQLSDRSSSGRSEPNLHFRTKTNSSFQTTVDNQSSCLFRRHSLSPLLHAALGKWSSEDTGNLKTSRREGEKPLYRDFMPSAWQSLVTHRVHVGVSDKNQGRCPTYTSEWVQPPLPTVDEFTVNDVYYSGTDTIMQNTVHY